MPFSFQRSQQSKTHTTCQQRRRFLRYGVAATGGVVGSLILPKAFAGTQSDPGKVISGALPSHKTSERKLSFLNLHTGERLSTTYWADGQYQPEELAAINHILRDHRTGDVTEMDTALLELLNMLHNDMDSRRPFHIISGYRSPKTNAELRKTSSGVAKKSMHMQGRAIDIRLPGCRLSSLHKAALECQAGGVGYYPKSNFIHVDTGDVRHWG